MNPILNEILKTFSKHIYPLFVLFIFCPFAKILFHESFQFYFFVGKTFQY